MLLNRVSRAVSSDLARTLYPFNKMVVPAQVKSDYITQGYKTAQNPQSLPKLPVPPLKDTLAKYLKSVQPFLSPSELSDTENLLNEFSSGIGVKLQCYLEEKAKKPSIGNWLEDWWLETAYLGFRWPVIIHSSPGLVLPMENFAKQEDQLDYAARAVFACLEFVNIIEKNALPIETINKKPLDMQQYQKIFGTCRIPGFPKDHLSYNKSPHIIVCYKNNYYLLYVLGKDGQPFGIDKLKSELANIVSSCKTPAEHQIGVFTADNRDDWAHAYMELKCDPYNAIYLSEIEKSLFVLCLDEPAGSINWKEATHKEKQTVAGQQTIHGNGPKENGGNRWFDKTLQVIVGKEGLVGFCYEHSPAEGQPIAFLADFMTDFVKNKKTGILKPTEEPMENFKELKFKVNSKIKKNLEKSKENMQNQIDNLSVNCFTYELYGKEFIKSQKLSPDSYIQMAIQFAFYRLHKTPGAHYESAATRMFLGGRTETIRSCSNESIAFAKAMIEKKPQEECLKRLKAAIDSHKKYTVDALHGLGVDRHLLGLRLAAKEVGVEEPKIFSSAAFKKSAHMRLSTSQVAVLCDGFMVYGPLVPDGYSTCYNPRKNTINIGTAAFTSNKETDVNKYAAALKESFDDMHHLLMCTTKSKV